MAAHDIRAIESTKNRSVNTGASTDRKVNKTFQPNYTETADKDTNWGFFGGLIRLCTEGYREDLMSEGRLEYLVYSHGEDEEIWTDTADIATNYTKINDI